MPDVRNRVTRDNPCLIVLVVDQSYSMSGPLAGGSEEKQDMLASAVNRLLYKIARFKCRKPSPTGDGSHHIRPYFHIGLVGHSDDQVYSAFGGSLHNRSTVPIDEVASNAIAVVDQVTEEDGIVETQKMPLWLRPKAEGNTPLATALEHSVSLVQTWLAQWPNVTVPPIVLNITDAEYNSGGDPAPAAERLRQITVGKERVLLFNLHVSDDTSDPVLCPHTHAELPAGNDWARLLFDMSSELTPQMLEVAHDKGHTGVSSGARGFGFNADFSTVMDFLEIGTQVLEGEETPQLPTGER